jgi:hypothetical protein
MAEVEPHNFCEPSIIVDLRSEFDEIPEMQGVHGKEKYSRGIKLRGDSTFRHADEVQETDP